MICHMINTVVCLDAMKYHQMFVNPHLIIPEGVVLNSFQFYILYVPPNSGDSLYVLNVRDSLR